MKNQEFDNLVKNRLKNQKASLPKGVEARIQSTLETLPSKKKSFSFSYGWLGGVAAAVLFFTVGIGQYEKMLDQKNPAPSSRIDQPKPLTIDEEGPQNRGLETSEPEEVATLTEAEKKLGQSILVPTQLPERVSLQVIRLHGNESVVLEYSETKGEVSFNIVEEKLATSSAQSLLEGYESSTDANGDLLYEKSMVGSTPIYVSKTGVNLDVYTAECIVKDTYIRVNPFSMEFSKDEILQILTSMLTPTN